MFDVDRLNEAAEFSGCPHRNANDHVWAAEALRMVAAGQPLWRCFVHDSDGWFDYPEARQSDAQCWVSALDPDVVDDCVMVEGWWMPTGKDET